MKVGGTNLRFGPLRHDLPYPSIPYKMVKNGVRIFMSLEREVPTVFGLSPALMDIASETSEMIAWAIHAFPSRDSGTHRNSGLYYSLHGSYSTASWNWEIVWDKNEGTIRQGRLWM